MALVALVVIGGATRVMEAGLACPDWPLCYGALFPGGRMNLQVFLEWFHRLDAFLVGMALLVLFGLTLLLKTRLPGWLPHATGAALLLVTLQGALGALTVMGLLSASTVTAHLAAGLGLVLLLSAMHQAVVVGTSEGSAVRTAPPSWWRPALSIASVPLLGQCVLGGAMASRWAADRCFSAGEACRWLALHRVVAWPSAVALLLLAGAALLLPRDQGPLRRFALAAGLLVPFQIALGLWSLRLQLEEAAVTVAHQLGAALLVALLGALWGRTLAPNPKRSNPLLEVAHG